MAEPGVDLGRERADDNAAWEAALDWLLALRAAPADRGLRRRLDAWLAADAGHRRAFAEAQRVWDVTGALPADRGAWPAPAASRPRRWPAMAAVLVVGLVTSLLAPPAWERLQHDYVAGTAQRLEAALPDGSRLQLDAGSVADFSAGATARTLTLHHGAVYLEVATDAGRPFRVAAGNTRVTVTGTRFTVRRLGATTRVAVAEGRVRVEGPAGSGRELGAGQASIGGHAVTIHPERVAAWRRDRLVLRDVTVAEAVTRLRPYHRGYIHLGDEALATRRVSGIFNLNDPQAALAAVVAPHGGQVTALSPWLLLVGDY